MRKCLLRLTILQLSQIFFTADFIFIFGAKKRKTRKNPYFSILYLFKNYNDYNTPLLKKLQPRTKAFGLVRGEALKL